MVTKAIDRAQRISLTVRAVFFVSLAMLPLGGVAIWQTDQIIEDQRDTAQRALVAVTEKAATRERQIIERSIGAAAALGNTARSLQADTELCRTTLDQFERGSVFYSYVGFTGPDGVEVCGSSDQQSGETGRSKLKTLVEQQKIGLYTERNADTDRQSVLVVATPAFQSGEYAGHMHLHIPHAGFEPKAELLSGERPLGLVTFNEYGEILTSESLLSAARDMLPEGIMLQDLRHEESYSFFATSRAGEERAYAFIPLVPGSAYALGTWSTDTRLLRLETAYWPTILLAGLMWLASVLVVSLVMQLLVIRGVIRLHRHMKLFQTRRTLAKGPVLGRGELYDLETDFRDLTETILRDEAHLENVAHEKDVLLKEVHHRVKNNLQLINSIINMVLRGSTSEETRVVVRRLQDRVMALASVHRSIYQAQTMDRVEASEIVREIVNQGVAVGLPRGSEVDVELTLAPVTLYPDQAMPLSLLVSEAITNALKYVGGPEAFIHVTLREDSHPDDPARKIASITVLNSVGDKVEDEAGTGLGSQLVRAFAHQLGGEPEVIADATSYSLRVTFEVAEFSPDAEDLPKAAE
ncbi:sensor histidine kinase [Roseobacter weihaiensis]|uniref:sensor histidine kinase n=1 Tax=Roseobacter weihaiensis TaxID=2763262 RepID=UPI001D0ACD5B|nr:sensor histidine kinase [Roseobacter sp. H9]